MRLVPEVADFDAVDVQRRVPMRVKHCEHGGVDLRERFDGEKSPSEVSAHQKRSSSENGLYLVGQRQPRPQASRRQRSVVGADAAEDAGDGSFSMGLLDLRGIHDPAVSEEPVEQIELFAECRTPEGVDPGESRLRPEHEIERDTSPGSVEASSSEVADDTVDRSPRAANERHAAGCYHRGTIGCLVLRARRREATR